MREVEYPSIIALRAREFRERHQHPCIDCGKPVSKHNAIRCKSCAAKIYNAARRIPYPLCIDCGKTLTTRKGIRCLECWRKFSKIRSISLETGKFLSSQGYVMVRSVEHPRARSHGYVLEHILVLEEKLGRHLADDEIGHHLNGKRDDNRPENLVALTKSGHRRQELGELYKKRIRQLERELIELRNGRKQLF